MGSITATQTAGRGYVRLDIDWTSHPNAQTCKVWRVVNGVLTPLRDGYPCELSGSKAVIYDTEMPMDTLYSYRTAIAVNFNGSFESIIGVPDWQIQSTNIFDAPQRTTDFYVPGTGNASLGGMPNPSLAGDVQLLSEKFPATAGVTYRVNGWGMINRTWNDGVGLVIAFYNGSNVFISQVLDVTDLWPNPGEWRNYEITATAPALTATAQIGFVVHQIATPPGVTGMTMYTDEIYATVDNVTTVDSATLTFASAGGGWWTDPLHPATMVRLICDLQERSICRAEDLIMFMGLGDKTRPADASLLEVPDAERGVGIFAARKAVRDAIQVLTMNPTAADRVRALHASGAPVLLQLPAKYSEIPRYRLYADKASGRIATDQTVGVRIHGLQGTDSGAPVGRAEGVLGSRYLDETKYVTYSAAGAASATWTDWAQGKLSSAT